MMVFPSVRFLRRPASRHAIASHKSYGFIFCLLFSSKNIFDTDGKNKQKSRYLLPEEPGVAVPGADLYGLSNVKNIEYPL